MIHNSKPYTNWIDQYINNAPENACIIMNLQI